MHSERGLTIVVLISIGFSSVLFAILAIPLIKRSVPPNITTGLRLRATLENEHVWYEANATCGRDMLCSGVGISVLTVVLFFLPGISALVYALACAAAVLVAALFLAIHGWMVANRCLRQQQARVSNLLKDRVRGS